MAIVFEQQKKSVNWFGVLIGVFAACFIAFAVYYLFFAPSPKIDVVLPQPLQVANKISNITFTDPSEITQNPAFKVLKTVPIAQSVGSLGRPNPLLPF